MLLSISLQRVKRRRLEHEKGKRLLPFFVLSESINLRYILQEGLVRAKTVSARRLIRAKTVSSWAPAKFLYTRKKDKFSRVCKGIYGYLIVIMISLLGDSLITTAFSHRKR